MGFLLGSDKKEWVWVMGEHKEDLSVEQILEKEAQEHACRLAEQEADELRSVLCTNEGTKFGNRLQGSFSRVPSSSEFIAPRPLAASEHNVKPECLKKGNNQQGTNTLFKKCCAKTNILQLFVGRNKRRKCSRS